MISDKKKSEIEDELKEILDQEEKKVFDWLHNNQSKLVDFAKILYEEKSLDFQFMQDWKKKNYEEVHEVGKEDQNDNFLELVEMAYSINSNNM